MDQQRTITYQRFTDRQEMPAADNELLTIAEKATATAYAPYSDFKVGVALRLENGLVVTGSNQENAAFPVCVCAEQVALAHAGSNYNGVPILSMAVATEAKQTRSGPLAPCGACRQIISEYERRGGKQIRLILQGGEKDVFIFDGVSPLLPFAFDETYF